MFGTNAYWKGIYLVKVFDSALLYENQAYDLARRNNLQIYLSDIFESIGHIYLEKRDFKSAEINFKKGTDLAIGQNSIRSIIKTYSGLANVFLQSGATDSSLLYAHKSLKAAKALRLPRPTYYADTLLASIFEARGELDSAFYYLKAAAQQRNIFLNAQNTQNFKIL